MIGPRARAALSGALVGWIVYRLLEEHRDWYLETHAAPVLEQRCSAPWGLCAVEQRAAAERRAAGEVTGDG